MNEKMFIVGKEGRFLSTPLAVFDDRKKATEWKNSANLWYGEGHPLHPLTIWPNEPLKNPKPFPNPNGSIDSIFATLDED